MQDAIADLLWCAPWLAASSPDAGTATAVGIAAMPSLRELARHGRPIGSSEPGDSGIAAAPTALELAASRAAERIAQLDRMARLACDLAAMEYDFLYDSARDLLAIGYNVDERRLDDSYYDLLASEARLASFVAIAQGELPQESWFALGRQLTAADGDPLLLSWSGSMFEYL